MNLIEESFQNKEEKKKKKTTGIILGAIILVVLIIIGIASYLFYIQSTTMRLILDGQSNESLKQLLVFENDGTIYAPIKEIASYLGYESYNGEYTQKSENQSKCYVQNENEVANFSLASNEIYKLDLTTDDNNYEIVYSDMPVKSINGVLYASSEAIEKAFNVSFQYSQEENRVYIYTLPYLVQIYSPRVLDFGYTEISDVFANQKTVLQDLIVVAKDGNQRLYGVVDVNGNTIMEAKYDNITYLPATGDFKVESDEKVGILGDKGETKVQIMYDSIDLMDGDAGLYVASNGEEYGVIDLRGNIRSEVENDEIGMDISPFKENNIKNKYILAGNLIPVRNNDLWGLYDIKGNQVVDFEYDSFGYIKKTNRDALSLLVIPDYEVLVACKDEKYTLLNSAGQELFYGPVADDIYMTINGGENHYYITVNDQTMDAEQYLDNIGIRRVSEGGGVSDRINNNNTSNNTSNNNTTNSNLTSVQNNNNNNQEINEGQSQENDVGQNQENSQGGENGQSQQGNGQIEGQTVEQQPLQENGMY